MADKFVIQRSSDPTSIGGNIKEWPSGSFAADLPPETKGICLNADGTLDVTNEDGTTEAGVPALKMVPLPFVPKKVTAIGTATKIYRIY